MSHVTAPPDPILRKTSHANERLAWRRVLLDEKIGTFLRGAAKQEFQAAAECLHNLSA
jgi:hypothetical protein